MIHKSIFIITVIILLICIHVVTASAVDVTAKVIDSLGRPVADAVIDIY